MAKFSVYKYPVEIDGVQKVRISADSVFTSVSWRFDELVIYFLGTQKKPFVIRKFRFFSTAQEFQFTPETMVYMGSVKSKLDYYHCFEILSEA